MRLPKVFAHIVLYNSDLGVVRRAVAKLIHQEEFRLGENLQLLVSDNASRTDPIPTIRDNGPSVFTGLQFYRHQNNLGFCGGHNFGVKRFLESGDPFLLILNPDVALEPTTLATLVERLLEDQEAAIACPKLLRANSNLEPLVPWKIDCCGMLVNRSLRHFDRGAEEPAEGNFARDEYVFGASGACMLIRREAVLDLLLEGEKHEGDLARVYPELHASRAERSALFDEAFFAYREDAELAWRAQYLGWRCRYVGDAIGYHIRVVTPERRSRLPRMLNRLGVRNRFLLQLNLADSIPLSVRIRGVYWRNFLVLIAVILKEWSSLPALLEVWKLRHRALERRKILLKRAKRSSREVWRWFLMDAPFADTITHEEDSVRRFDLIKKRVAL